MFPTEAGGRRSPQVSRQSTGPTRGLVPSSSKPSPSSSPGDSSASSASRPPGSRASSRPASACIWPAQTEDGKGSVSPSLVCGGHFRGFGLPASSRRSRNGPSEKFRGPSCPTEANGRQGVIPRASTAIAYISDACARIAPQRAVNSPIRSSRTRSSARSGLWPRRPTPTFKVLRRVSLAPQRIGEIVAAALALFYRERPPGMTRHAQQRDVAVNTQRPCLWPSPVLAATQRAVSVTSGSNVIP